MRFQNVAGTAARSPAAYPQVISPMWASIRVNEVNPVQRCQTASRSCPTARSTTGMRAISSTCTSSRSDAIRPVHRPSDINAFAQLVRSVRPPPAIHQYVTSSSPPATAVAPTARTAASARAARLSIAGTGGAEGIASVVVTSTSRYSRYPCPTSRCRRERCPPSRRPPRRRRPDRPGGHRPHPTVRGGGRTRPWPPRARWAGRRPRGRSRSRRRRPGRAAPRRPPPGRRPVAGCGGFGEAPTGTAGNTPSPGAGCAAGVAIRSVAVSPSGLIAAPGRSSAAASWFSSRAGSAGPAEWRHALGGVVRPVHGLTGRCGRLPAGSAVRLLVAHGAPSRVGIQARRSGWGSPVSGLCVGCEAAIDVGGEPVLDRFYRRDGARSPVGGGSYPLPTRATSRSQVLPMISARRQCDVVPGSSSRPSTRSSRRNR